MYAEYPLTHPRSKAYPTSKIPSRLLPNQSLLQPSEDVYFVTRD